MKLYDLNSLLNFGKCKGQKLNVILDENPKYIDWCFQKIEWFCITDEIFNRLPIIIYLRTQNDKNSHILLHNLKEKHLKKNENLINESSNNNSIESYVEDKYYDETNWLIEVAGTDNPETMNDVYWNLD